MPTDPAPVSAIGEALDADIEDAIRRGAVLPAHGYFRRDDLRALLARLALLEAVAVAAEAVADRDWFAPDRDLIFALRNKLAVLRRAHQAAEK